jgi:membrane-bound metal-dependent hydrolase YbcI (DUF457 family)
MVANLAHNRRDRILITAAGVAPDLDGLGIIPEVLTRGSAHPLPWFTEYHHVLGHNLGFALVVAAFVAIVAREKTLGSVLAFVAFQLHLFCDLIGARGPEGYQWPIPLLSPFSDRLQLVWPGQWALNAWPNFAITIALLIAAVALAVKRGHSPVELVSSKADGLVVAALRKRFQG